MPKYRPKGCKCTGKRRYISSGIANNSDCIDVCTNPICGTSDKLTLLAPVVYDEIGINLCRDPAHRSAPHIRLSPECFCADSEH